jgi:uncharacterized protein (DUF1501 family)
MKPGRAISLDPPALQRRRLLKTAALLGLLAPMARQVALAQSPLDYRALVCIFLEGGNDGENTVIRYDTAGYQTYASIRPPASSLNIPQSRLLPIQPARGGPPFGFNPACAALRDLFVQKQLAVVANMGVLAAPSTKSGLETQGAPRPVNLFSHADQQRSMGSAVATSTIRTGWGGRIADRLNTANGGSLFPPAIAADQGGIFASGLSSLPLTVGGGATLQFDATSDPQADALAEAAMQQILAQPRPNIYDIAAQLDAEESLASRSVLSPLLTNSVSVVRPLFSGLTSDVAGQLLTIALILEGRQQIGLRRQVFYVHQSGYDTHGNQLQDQGSALTDLSQAVAAFQNAMSALGLTNNVTTFTLSDFGRTFQPASGNGTDHGWGNYAFVIGGAVNGGDFYGTLPTPALNGPDDLGNAGRWIPTTSLEQYGATLARWFGIAEGDLPYVFPNIGSFANTNLGFMG